MTRWVEVVKIQSSLANGHRFELSTKTLIERSESTILQGLSASPIDEYIGVLRTTVRCINDSQRYLAKVTKLMKLL
jgi:hypothetical protein